MKVTKMKKALLIMGLGLGLSAAMTNTAVALPTCETLAEMCAEGNGWACFNYNRVCW